MILINKEELKLHIESFENKALEYALNVVNGKEVTGKYVKKECERFIWRYENQNTDKFPYIFDKSIVYKINTILYRLKFPTGFKTGERILEGLFDFQFFILHNIFAWVHRETGYRLISKVYLELARKSGKKFA